MTKEITKAYILQEMQDKFKLRELEPSRFTFSEEVIPVYDISFHLEHRTVYSADVSITATGPTLFFTVPEDERWFIRAYNAMPLGSGAFTMAGMYIQRGPVASNYMYLDLEAAQTVSYLKTLSPRVIVDPGDQIFMNIDGYTSVQTLRVKLDVAKETIR